MGQTAGRLLWRKGRAEDEKEAVLQRLEERGSAYVARLNTLYVREFRMAYTAEEIARFLHHACRGLPLRANGHTSDPIRAEDLFYARALENALAYLGSRVMYPPRPPLREADLYELYEETCEDVEQQSSFTLGEFMKMADFMILHREFELNPQHFPETPKPIEEGVQSTGEKFDYARRLAAALCYVGLVRLDSIEVLPFAARMHEGKTSGGGRHRC